MHSKELNERSPLRLLEQSIHGGLGRGNLGVIVAPAGVGKTAFLVGVALDDLMRGRKVLHVALDEPVEKIRDYYDEIFMDLARTSGLEDIEEERLRVERNRNIHTYLGNTFSIDKLKDAIAFLRTHMDFSPEALIIEGFHFERATVADMDALREVARNIDGELWMSAITAEGTGREVFAPLSRLAGSLDVILCMQSGKEVVHLRLLKDHENPDVTDSHVALDPVTLLLVPE
jgi:reverse gyrase